MKAFHERSGNKYKKKMSNMHSKLIRVGKGLSLNQVIEFGCIYVRRGFLNLKDLSC
jgi:hypothetical protein